MNGHIRGGEPPERSHVDARETHLGESAFGLADAFQYLASITGQRAANRTHLFLKVFAAAKLGTERSAKREIIG
jgi:hypothetical protein